MFPDWVKFSNESQGYHGCSLIGFQKLKLRAVYW